MLTATSLLETQRALLRAIACGDNQSLGALLISDEIGVAERIAIHRNTATNTLMKALRLSHPAVHRLLGAEFFEVAAQRFLEHEWPRVAWLDEFGAGFAGFLAGFEAAATIAYLGDVARLDWAVHQALHAPDAAVLDVKRLAAVPGEQSGQLRFLANPSLRLVHVNWPVDEIWRAVIEEDDAALRALDVRPGQHGLLVQRASLIGVQVQRLSEIPWRFAGALCAGVPLQEAIESMPRDLAQLGLDELLGHLLAAGRFTDFCLGSSEAS